MKMLTELVVGISLLLALAGCAALLVNCIDLIIEWAFK